MLLVHGVLVCVHGVGGGGRGACPLHLVQWCEFAGLLVLGGGVGGGVVNLC